MGPGTAHTEAQGPVRRVLVSNDDGYLAAGLIELARALAEVAQVTVVAPDRDRSGASNSLTLARPLRAKSTPNGFICVDGTPTDCVHLALTGLLTEPPDMVISGINHGANLGDDVLYSGTVAAAMEGRFLGRPALAVSLALQQGQHFETASAVVLQLLGLLAQHPLPADTILNVNVPDLPLAQIAGFESTRLGRRHKAEPAVRGEDPAGRPIFWVGPPGPEADAGPGTDFYAVKQGRVSITPLHTDLTRYSVLTDLASWLCARL